MYVVCEFLILGMLGMCSLFLLAELIDMIATARRHRLGGPVAPGSFNLQPPESKLSRRYFHTSRTSGGSWGGLNKFD